MPTSNQFELVTISPDQLEYVSGGYSDALFAAMQHAVANGMTINSTTTGTHAKNSYHYQGRAFDAIGSETNMNRFYNWAAANTHSKEVIHGHRFLKNGHNVHGIGGHMGHVHLAI